MTIRDKLKLQVIKEFNEVNLSKSIGDYFLFLDTLVYLNQTLTEAKKRFEKWEIYGDTLMSKIIFHSQSLFTLLSGTYFKSNYLDINQKILDVPSANILLRGLLEGFLMYYFIYVNPSTKAEKQFRYNVWMMSSLLSRQQYEAVTYQSQKVKEQDKKEIDTLK